MKKIFSILLSLALVVSLSLVAAAPVMAVELPSISPTSVEYDLDNPGHIAINMDFGDATDLLDIEDDNGTLTPDSDYYQFEQLLVIDLSYLQNTVELECVGDEWVLQFNFTTFGVAFLTITTVGTAPALEDDEAEWNIWDLEDVVVGIDWGIAGDIDDVSDAGGSLGEGSDWDVVGDTLVIYGDTGEYLALELLSIGDDVELTIEFDSCQYDVVYDSVPHTATLTIEAVGVSAPRLAPSSATYDLCNPDDLEFTVTWDGATAGSGITSVKDVTILGPGYPQPLTVTTHYTVAGTTLTILDAWLSTKFLASGSIKVLEVTFDDAATSKVTIMISSAWSDQPFMGVTSNIYTYDIDTGLGNLGASGVGSLANFGCATNVTGVRDNLGYQLTTTTGVGSKCSAYYLTYDYITMYITGYGYLVIVTPYYLACQLVDLGDTRTMSVGFDKGANATFIINAVGTQPSISPTSAEFNLDDPADVTTTVTLGPNASSFDIVGLTIDEDYTVSGDTVSINASYLSSVLEEVDDVTVLTFDFDKGEDGKLTIRAIGTPLCFIATAAGADAPELDILREFRDKVLRPSSLGAKLVSLYYEASPPIAELISQNEALKAVVKACLIDPIVAILNWSQCLWS